MLDSKLLILHPACAADSDPTENFAGRLAHIGSLHAARAESFNSDHMQSGVNPSHAA